MGHALLEAGSACLERRATLQVDPSSTWSRLFHAVQYYYVSLALLAASGLEDREWWITRYMTSLLTLTRPPFAISTGNHGYLCCVPTRIYTVTQ